MHYSVLLLIYQCVELNLLNLGGGSIDERESVKGAIKLQVHCHWFRFTRYDLSSAIRILAYVIEWVRVRKSHFEWWRQQYFSYARIRTVPRKSQRVNVALSNLEDAILVILISILLYEKVGGFL